MQWSGLPVLYWALSFLDLGCALREVDNLSRSDAQFCRGGLEVLYPGLRVTECSVVPRDRSFREKISTQWGAPKVRLPEANKKMTYTLIMVDPDAPSRSNPTRCSWRHWLVADIAGSDLKKGAIKGKVLSEYRRPTPPPKTGFHRYQFLLFEQKPKKTVSLSPEEQKSLGNWDVQTFIQRFSLGTPVATLQFLTQNASD
ncbi:phosphatidylethanolamine-binding protein 4 [Amia ocellicauda]|uniref:phosphatidylethanolamine-binding protein 4 n=1 Tax=Amia ocellicauda TaxID=2972642 RepID=UPI003463EE4E